MAKISGSGIARRCPTEAAGQGGWSLYKIFERLPGLRWLSPFFQADLRFARAIQNNIERSYELSHRTL